jgi:hypothetical protein
VYAALPILERGQLPGPNDEEPDRPYADYAGVKDIDNATSVRISPNPVHDVLTIEHAKGQHLVIYSITGQVILKKDQLRDTESISVADWLPGTYIINLQSLKSNANIINIKIIKI